MTKNFQPVKLLLPVINQLKSRKRTKDLLWLSALLIQVNPLREKRKLLCDLLGLSPFLARSAAIRTVGRVPNSPTHQATNTLQCRVYYLVEDIEAGFAAFNHSDAS